MMRVYEHIDEKGRIYDITYTMEEPQGKVWQSHGFSYLYARNMMKQAGGGLMGLEKDVEYMARRVNTPIPIQQERMRMREIL